MLHDGDTVLLKVSRGQKIIPNVSGMTEAEARAALGSDFNPSTQRRGQRHDRQGPGHAHRSRAVGTRVPVGSNVTLFISTGPARCRCRT